MSPASVGGFFTTKSPGKPHLHSLKQSLTLCRLQKEIAIEDVAYKQRKFISHSPEGWEVQDQGTSQIWCSVRACFQVHR